MPGFAMGNPQIAARAIRVTVAGLPVLVYRGQVFKARYHNTVRGTSRGISIIPTIVIAAGLEWDADDIVGHFIHPPFLPELFLYWI